MSRFQRLLDIGLSIHRNSAKDLKISIVFNILIFKISNLDYFEIELNKMSSRVNTKLLKLSN